MTYSDIAEEPCGYLCSALSVLDTLRRFILGALASFILFHVYFFITHSFTESCSFTERHFFYWVLPEDKYKLTFIK